MIDEVINKEYLESVGIKGPLQDRIEEIYEFYKEVCPEEITKMFISEYLQKDNSRVHENLWFFSQKYCMEAHSYIGTDEFDLELIHKRIIFCIFTKENYDFKEEKENSSLHIKASLLHERRLSLKASKHNCRYLKEIYKEFIVPNFVD